MKSGTPVCLAPILSLILFNVCINVFAELPKKELRSFGEYTLEAQRPCNDFQQYNKCYPATLTCPVFDGKKSVVANLEAVYYEHGHPFEVHGHEIFWIKRVGDYKVDKNWEDQLWVMDLQSKSQTELLHYPGIEFMVSPDGKMVAYTKGQELLMLDRTKNTSQLLGKKDDAPGADEGYSLLGWANDGGTFWFGSGVVEGWKRLGLYKAGKIIWCPNSVRGTMSDLSLNIERGWLAISDAPFIFDTVGQEDFEKSKRMIHLTVVDVFSGKNAFVAEGITNYFKPSWTLVDDLEFSLNGERHKASADEIKGKLIQK